VARLNYVELPSKDIAASQRFFAEAFGFAFSSFGPSYAATTSGDVDLGLQADSSEATAAPLAVIDVPDLDAALVAVQQAGGTVTKPAFAFPGGRRFHFLDPSGNELAAVTTEDAG
jgi:uncharacterized protein